MNIRLCKLIQKFQRLPILVKGAELREEVHPLKARNDLKLFRIPSLMNRQKLFPSNRVEIIR